MSRRTETAYKAQSPGESAPHDEAPDSGDLPASGWSGSRQRRPRMLRLCSESLYLQYKGRFIYGAEKFYHNHAALTTNKGCGETVTC